MSDVVLPDVEVTPLDHIVAFLKKLAAYAGDVRTVAMVMTIIMGLKVIGVLKIEVDEANVSATLTVVTEIIVALANLATVLLPVWKYVDSVTKRPTRGLTPWLDEVKAKKAATQFKATARG